MIRSAVLQWSSFDRINKVLGQRVITDAIKYVNAKMDHLNNQEKEILQDIKQKEGKEPQVGDFDQHKTTNGIF
jgi:hypothetical protein